MFHRVKAENEKPVTMPTKPQETVEDKTQTAPAEESAPIETPQTESTQEEVQTMTEETQTPEAEETNAEVKPLDIPQTANYGAAAAGQRSGGYAGYAGYGSSQPSGSSEKGQTERRLVIGQGITMSGEIESCDHLIVEGTIEAALKGANVLHVAESGTFYGAVDIEEATIAGRFEGELTVNGRLTVRSSGSITGTIAYKELAIEAGAVIDGKLSPLKAGEAKASAPKKPQADKMKSAKEAAALAKARELKAQSGEKQPANNDEGELFSSEVSAAE